MRRLWALLRCPCVPALRFRCESDGLWSFWEGPLWEGPGAERSGAERSGASEGESDRRARGAGPSCTGDACPSLDASASEAVRPSDDPDGDPEPVLRASELLTLEEGSADPGWPIVPSPANRGPVPFGSGEEGVSGASDAGALPDASDAGALPLDPSAEEPLAAWADGAGDDVPLADAVDEAALGDPVFCDPVFCDPAFCDPAPGDSAPGDSALRCPVSERLEAGRSEGPRAADESGDDSCDDADGASPSDTVNWMCVLHPTAFRTASFNALLNRL